MASMSNSRQSDGLPDESLRCLQDLVESSGVKRFGDAIGVTPRQVNRILSGSQPNPIERLILALQCVEADTGDRVLDYICQEMGGHFVRQEGFDDAAVNAVKECAEAIAAISDGQINEIDIREIREAISALSSLMSSIRDQRDRPSG